MEQGTDQGMDSGDAGRWLTYRELAESRQIDRHSAVKLVLKHGWRRQRDNRNVLRVLVPVEWMAPRAKGMPSGTDRAMPSAMPQGMDQGTDFASLTSAFSDALTTLREQLERSEARAQAAEKGREAVESEARALRERLEQAEAAVEQARREAVHEAREAAQALDALRAVEAARLAQGLLARLRAAWRGR